MRPPLPVWGPDVQAVAAAGSMLFASTFNAPDGRTLFVSTDGGASWTPADPPPLPAGWTLASMALSPDGSTLAGLADGRLWLGRLDRSGGQPALSWSDAAPFNLFAFAYDPHAAARLVAVGGTAGSGVWWATLSGAHPGVYRSQPGAAVWTRATVPVVGPVPGALRAGPDGLWIAAAETGGAAVRVRLPGAAPGTGAAARLAAWGGAARQALRAAAAHLAGRTWAPPVQAQVVWGAGSGPLALDPYDRGSAYAGLRRSLNGGQTWSLIPSGPDGWNPLAAPRGYAFDPGSPAAAMAADRAVLRDAGAAWTALAEPEQGSLGTQAPGA